MKLLLAMAFGCAAAACASSSFTLSGKEMREAEDAAIQRDMAAAAAEGIHGTWLPMKWSSGRCRWSAHDEAECVTKSRSSSRRPWRARTVKVRRDSDGNWELKF